MVVVGSRQARQNFDNQLGLQLGPPGHEFRRDRLPKVAVANPYHTSGPGALCKLVRSEVRDVSRDAEKQRLGELRRGPFQSGERPQHGGCVAWWVVAHQLHATYGQDVQRLGVTNTEGREHSEEGGYLVGAQFRRALAQHLPHALQQDAVGPKPEEG